MPDNKSICLLGFSPESEARIKKVIHDDPNNHNVRWVPANYKGLDGVVINAGFLATPQIQKYLSMVSCPVVCAYNSNDGAEQAQTYHLTALDLRAPQHNMRAWLLKLFGNTGFAGQEASKTEKTSTESPRPHTAAAQHNTVKTHSQPHAVKTSASNTNTQELLSQIKRKVNTVIRAECGSDTTWIKPREGLVYINYPRESVPGFDLWTWRVTDHQDIPDSARKLQLDLWLFESLWQSEAELGDEVENDCFYRLIRFPQPLSRHGRTEALRLATCAQIHPVNIKLLHEKTAYPTDRIRRFLFATLTAGQVRKVTDTRNIPSEPIQKKRSPQEEQKVEQKRSLLQRFRAKLGL